MALETQGIAVGAGEHVVKFYDHDAEGYGGALVDDTALVLSGPANSAMVYAGSPLSIVVRAQDSMFRPWR